MPDNRNFLIAIVLSVGVLIAWQFFVAGPELRRLQDQQATQQSQQAAGQAGGPAVVPGATGTAGTAATGAATGTAASLPATGATDTTVTRDQALAQSPRVEIRTASITGSINLIGGRIDDVRLNNYRETVEPDSPTITLLSPTGAPNAYFAEFGWIGPVEAGPLPGADTQWTAPTGARLTEETPVELTWDNGAGLLFKRTVAVDERYMFTFTDTVQNTGSASVALSPFARVTRLGEQHTTGSWILHEGLIGVIGEDGLQQYNYGDIRKAGEVQWPDVTRGWLGIVDKYWATVIVPKQDVTYTARFLHVDQGTPLYQTDYRGAAITVAPGATATDTTRLFAGAKVVSILDHYESSLGIERFRLLIDWGWLWFITQPLFYLIDWFYRLFGNFGVAILAVTVVVKAIFFPLANKSYKSMSAMKKVQPEMMALRERYKDDKAKQQQALMELYKKEKINPLAGCWPVAVQIPVFFALYSVLYVTIEMRHAPFFGWIQDLAAPDPTTVFNLFGLLPFDPSTVPVIGGFLLLGAWPIIMGITMFVQMRLNPTPPDPTQAMIFTWMPVIFTFFLAHFPAGLVIYWAWNNTLSVLQQYFIMRRSGTEVNLWQNILESLGLRPRKPQTALATPAPAAAPANDDTPEDEPAATPAGGKKKKKKQKAKG